MQGVYKSSLTNIQEISEMHFFNSRTFLSDQTYNIKTQVKLVMSINEQVTMSSDQRSSLCNPTRLLIYSKQLHINSKLGQSRVNRVCTTENYTHTHTHARGRLTALFPGLPGWASTRKVKLYANCLCDGNVHTLSNKWFLAFCNTQPMEK